MKRVVAYLRKLQLKARRAKIKQAGLPAQREHITAYAAQEGLRLPSGPQFEGISGAMVDRPSCQGDEGAENGEFDLVSVARWTE